MIFERREADSCRREGVTVMNTVKKTIGGVRAKIGKILPPYAVKALIILAASNLLIYYGARALNEMLGRPYLNMAGPVDAIIPVIPAFSIIYVIAFPFWYVTYFMVCCSDRERCRRLVTADVVAKVICGVIFVVLPTANIRPELTGNGIGETVLGFIYASDSPDNLFPSIHCLESWICFRALKEEERVPEWLKASAFVLAILICLSTLFTKQHLLPDALAGVMLADVIWNLQSVELIKTAHQRGLIRHI